MTIVVRTYNHAIVGVVGPKYGKSSKGNIGHLVEEGHQKVLWGRRTDEQVTGYPFLKPAWDNNVHEVARTLGMKMGIGIEREAMKLRRR